MVQSNFVDATVRKFGGGSVYLLMLGLIWSDSRTLPQPQWFIVAMIYILLLCKTIKHKKCVNN